MTSSARLTACIAVAASAFAGACSLVVSTDDLSGGVVDAGAPDCDGCATLPDGGVRGADGEKPAPPPYVAPSCGGAGRCFPTPPLGWTGPVAFYEGNGSADPGPPCAADYPTMAYEGKGGLDAGTPQCDCACGPIDGGTCGAATFTAYRAPGCNNPCGAPVPLAPNTCVNVEPQVGCDPTSAKVDLPTANGSCTALPGASVIPPATWSGSVRACSPSATDAQGCASGSSCMPAPPASFSTKLCIVSTGDVECPAGVYAIRHVYWESVDDSRACPACTCTPPKCTGKLEYDDSCPPSVGTLQLGAACLDTQAFDAYRFVPDPVTGSCTPSASSSAPTGAATPTEPTTVCCVP